MMQWRKSLCLLLGVVLAVCLTSCEEGTDVVGPGGDDTTAPFVVSVNPPMDETNVATSATITVTFSEDMDQDAVSGSVTLSSGTITSMTWSDARTLVIAHDPWSEGTEVMVTLGTGLVDTSDNALEATFILRFWTQTSDIRLLASDPGQGLTGVLRNTPVSMLFSQDMNVSSLETAITVMNGATPIGFDLAEGDDDWVIMTFTELLPANATIEVTISTAAETVGGGNLTAEATFSFTTGDTTDETPPNVVSVEPASGSTIAATGSFIRFRFDEPIDTEDFSPSMMSAQFWLQVDSGDQEGGVEPVWSENNTVITVALPNDLPAGMPIAIRFDSYRDRVGNEQDTDLSYEVTVAGTPDYFPIIDGLAFGYDTHELQGMNEVTQQESWDIQWTRYEQDGDQYRRVRYADPTFTDERQRDYFSVTGNGVEFLGFRDESDVYFDAPVMYAQLPWQTGSWNGTLSADFGGETMTGFYTVQVFAREDVDFHVPAGAETGSEMDAELVWKHCWKWQLTYDITIGTEAMTGSWTQWFAPTVGVVKAIEAEVSDTGEWTSTDRYLIEVAD